VEFLEFGFDDLRDCRDIMVIVGGMVGEIPRGIEDRKMILTHKNEGRNLKA
jgi:hypothetical protein